jgi:hypothetical protein
MASEALKARRRVDYKFELEYRTRWYPVAPPLPPRATTDGRQGRQRHVPPPEQLHLLLPVRPFAHVTCCMPDRPPQLRLGRQCIPHPALRAAPTHLAANWPRRALALRLLRPH